MIVKRSMVVTLIGLLLFAFVPGALAADNGSANDKTDTLTIDQSFQMALKASRAIKSADISIDSSEKLRDAAGKVPGLYTPTGHNTSEVSFTAFTNLVSTNIALQSADKAKTKAIDQLAVSVFDAYTAVLKSNQNLKYAQNSFKNAQTQWYIALIKFQLGMIGQVERNSNEAQFKAAQSSLETARIANDMAYQNFNNLLGLQLDDRPDLIDRPEYSPLKVDNMDHAIAVALEASPDLWSASQAAYLAQLKVDLFDFAGQSYVNYEVSQSSAQQADLSVENVRVSLEKGVRDLYNSIMQLEQNFSNLQNAVGIAEDNLRVKQLMFKIGLATQLDVQTASLSLEKAQNDLAAATYSHESSKLVFAKPWLSGGGQ